LAGVGLVALVPHVFADDDPDFFALDTDWRQGRAGGEPAWFVENVVDGQELFGGGQSDCAFVEQNGRVPQAGVLGLLKIGLPEGADKDGRAAAGLMSQILGSGLDSLGKAGVEEDVAGRVAGDGHFRQDNEVRSLALGGLNGRD
jgi:hypothetical protein